MSNPLKNISKFFSPILSQGGSDNSHGSPDDSSTRAGTSSEPTVRRNPYSTSSPFPFGTPISYSRHSVLNPKDNTEGSKSAQSAEISLISRSRLRGKDVYGGRVMFGGTNTSVNFTQNLRRHNRLLASTPYQSSMRQRPNRNKGQQQMTNNPGTSSGTPSPASTPENVGMSSTARTILETLEKMSTPLRDAQKIPVPRAEKRQMLAEELLERGSILSESSKRKRPRLGATRGGFLTGPPLRTKILSPMPVTHLKSRSDNSSDLSTATSVKKVEENVTKNLTPNHTITSTTSGKVRAKVSEKAKARAEKNLDMNAADEEDIPTYLKKAVDNPFAQLNTLPTFQFGSPPVVKPAVTEEKKVSNSQPKISLPEPVKPSQPLSSPEQVLNKVLQTTTPMVKEDINEGYKFSFCEPKLQFTKTNSINASDHVFNFSIPSPVKNVDSSTSVVPTLFQVSNRKTSQLPDLTDVGSSNHKSPNGPTSLLGFVDKNPKVSNNLKTGSVMDFLGGNHKLPDVTASAGFIPAKSLKQGSVMDILGKSSGTDVWKNSTSPGKKPWA